MSRGGRGVGLKRAHDSVPQGVRRSTEGTLPFAGARGLTRFDPFVLKSSRTILVDLSAFWYV